MAVRTKLKRRERAQRTRDALLVAAFKVVARHGYAKASVARITEEAGVALGTLYSYFESHQKLLDEILVHEGQLLLNSLGAASSGSRTYFELEERAFTAFARYIARKPRFLRVLIEAEVAAPASYAEHMGNIERRYLAAFNRAVVSKELRPQSDEAFRAVAEILSGSRGHIAIGFSGRGGRVIPSWAVDAYVRFVRQGLGGKIVSLLPPQPSRPRIRPSDTRSALFHAAAEVVLEHGYGGATVAAITERAGFAVGTFYTYFESRQELLIRLLAYVRANMLEEVRAAVRGSNSFLEMEVRAFRAFFDHLSMHPWYTRIESETAVWAPEIFRQHFFEIADRYVAALLRSHAAGDLVDYEERELEVIAYILMAARHYLATRYFAGAPGARLPSAVIDAYVGLVSHGLAIPEWRAALD
jgi:AcrR family transcriptional regulator